MDLVLIQGSEALVIDVTVRFESGSNTLRDAANAKVWYYSPHKEQIAQALGIKDVQIYGFPLGARGLWYRGNEHVLITLGMGSTRVRSFARLTSRRALLYSLDILNSFSKEREKQPK